MIPSPYNNNLQFVETRTETVILNENIHDARVVPTDARPHSPVRRWAGDSRGHWDGDTLVVDTINFTDKTTVRGSDTNLHLVEQFTRIECAVARLDFLDAGSAVVSWIHGAAGGLPPMGVARTCAPVCYFVTRSQMNKVSTTGFVSSAASTRKVIRSAPWNEYHLRVAFPTALGFWLIS